MRRFVRSRYCPTTAIAVSAQSRNDLIAGRRLQLVAELKSRKVLRDASSASSASLPLQISAMKEMLMRQRAWCLTKDRGSFLHIATFVSDNDFFSRASSLELFFASFRIRASP